MSITFWSTRTIKLPTGEQTVHLPTIIHCYLLMHCLKDRPVAAVIMANIVANVANLMSEGTAPHMGKTCDRCKGINHFKAVCRSKVTAKTAQSPHRSKKSQPPRCGSTGSYTGQGKGGGNRQHQKRRPQRSHRSRMCMQ